MDWSNAPNPAVSTRPATFTVPKSERATFMLAFAAQPPLSLKSVNRNSFTHTSPLFTIPVEEVLRTPIMITFTSAKLGFPTIRIALSELSGSVSA